MRKKLTVTRKAYDRAAYYRKGGTYVSRASVPGSHFKVKDRGKPGKTPKSGQWYNPQVQTGWRKDLAPRTRRAKALNAHDGDLLATARSLISLHNVTTDLATKRAAKQDYRYFLERYKAKR